VVIFAKIVQYSYDPEKEVIPQFHILTETKKQFIASELEKEVEQVLEFQKKNPIRKMVSYFQSGRKNTKMGK